MARLKLVPRPCSCKVDESVFPLCFSAGFEPKFMHSSFSVELGSLPVARAALDKNSKNKACHNLAEGH